MKMSRPGVCCNRCFRLIAKQSTTAARLWLDLCEVQMERKLFGLVTSDNAALKTLETMRFITTTETPTMILVKVNGHQFHKGDNLFCGEKCNE